MADGKILNSGLQYVPQIAVQYIYLDFDGELTSYNGEILSLENVEVQNSSLTEERIKNILAELNARYADQHVVFVTQRPTAAGYSTIFVGKTTAFDQYGSFAGLAETIDEGNANKTDKAFVNLDSTATDTEIINTIAHETDHLTGTLDHGGESLQAYASDDDDEKLKTYYTYFHYNETFTGTLYSTLYLTHNSVSLVSSFLSSAVSGSNSHYYYYDSAVNVAITSGGILSVATGCTANGVTVRGGGSLVVRGGVANDVVVDGGLCSAVGRGTVNEITVLGGELYLGSDCSYNGVTLAPGVRITAAYGQNAWGSNVMWTQQGAKTASIAKISYSGINGNASNLNGYGHLTVRNGGIIENTVLSSGSLTIVSNGSARETTVLNGTFSVGYGGSAENTVISGGVLFNYDGIIKNTFIGSDCTLKIYNSGGNAYNTTLSHRGKLIWNASSSWEQQGPQSAFIAEMNGQGLTGTATNLNGSGTLAIRSGGKLENTTLSGGSIWISSGGKLENTTLSGGSIRIYDGGTATQTVISNGSVVISSGGVAKETTISSGLLSNGGVIDKTTVCSAGSLQLAGVGASAYNTTLYNGGKLTLQTSSWDQQGQETAFISKMDNYGLTGTATNLNGSGTLVIRNGGVAVNTTLSGGSIWISSGGKLENTTLSGGSIWISSGAVANNTVVYSGVSFTLYNDFKYQFSQQGDIVASITQMTGEGLTGTATNLNGSGSLRILEGGKLENTTLSGGFFRISSGAMAENTTLSGGSIWISSGAVAENTTLSGGSIWISSGAMTENTTLSGGFFSVGHGAVANNTVCSSGGLIWLPYINQNRYWEQQGEVAASITQMTGEGLTGTATNLNGNGSLRILEGGKLENTTLCKGYTTLFSGAAADKTVIGSDAGIMISSGAIAENTVISSGGSVLGNAHHWYQKNEIAASITEMTGEGLTGTATNLNGSGSLRILEGGVAINTTLSGVYADAYISSGGVAEVILVKKGAYLAVSSGGSASLVYNPWGGTVTSSAGAIIETWTPEYEYYFGNYTSGIVSKGNGISGQTISSGLSAIAFEGSVRDTTVFSGGVMHISSTAPFKKSSLQTVTLAAADLPAVGGVTGNTADGGSIRIYGNAFDNTAQNGGCIDVYALGLAENNQIEAQGTLTANDQSTLRNTTIAVGGKLTAKTANLYDTTINGSAVISGGITKNITVNQGGKLSLENGVFVTDLTIYGATSSYSGVVLGGDIKIYSRFQMYSDVTVNEGTTITFGLDDKNTKGLTNNYRYISECQNFVMETRSSKKFWSFILIDSAQSFDKTITFNNKAYGLWEVTDTGILVQHGDSSLRFFKYMLPRSREELRTFLSCSQIWNWQFSTTIFNMPDLTFGFDGFGPTVNKRKWLRFSIKGVSLSYTGELLGNHTFTVKGNLEFAAGILQIKGDLASSPDYGITLRYGEQINTQTNELELTEASWDIAGKFSVTLQKVDHRYKLFGHTYTVTGSLELDTQKEKLIVSGSWYLTDSSTITISADFSNIYKLENASDNALSDKLWDSLKGLSFSAVDIRWQVGALTIYSLELAWEQEVVSGKQIDFYSGSVGMSFFDMTLSVKVSMSIGKYFNIDMKGEWGISVVDISVKGKVASSGDYAMYGGVQLLTFNHSSLIGVGAELYIAHTTNGTESTSDDITFASGKLNFADIITAESSLTITDKKITLTLQGSVKTPKVLQWIGAAELYEGGLVYEYLGQGAGTHLISVWGKSTKDGKVTWYGSTYSLTLGQEIKLSKNVTLQNKIDELYEVVAINQKAVARYVNNESQSLHLYSVYRGAQESDITAEITRDDGTGFCIKMRDLKQQALLAAESGVSSSLLMLEQNGVFLQIESFTETGLTVHLTGQTAGEWSVALYCTDHVMESVLFSMETDKAKLGQFTLDQAKLEAEKLTLSYTCEVVEERADTISLYYDSDAAGFDGKFITTVDHSGSYTMDFAVNQWLKPGETGYFYLMYADNSIPAYSNYCAVTNPLLTLHVDEGGIKWGDIPEVPVYTVEYSVDNFATAVQITTPTNSIDTFGLPDGSWQWQVQTETLATAPGNNIVSTKETAPEVLTSDEDRDLDLFFGSANGVWGKKYAARHLGNGTWEGTQEQVLLKGKNKIADIFEGSSDANILVLTDDANGDALFVDDIYTDLGDHARFAQIDEIRAGAGDDIVDMTSERYAYEGDGITIYGGSGNDTIWGGAESNTLFGDAGNDRLVGSSGDDVIAGGSGNDAMHGGGGDDIFTFGGAFGNDTIEQLANGSVTLWFETGSEDNWDAETLTYSDGTNTVSVSGSVNVMLRFGADASLPAGSFEEETTRKVFEDKGMLA